MSGTQLRKILTLPRVKQLAGARSFSRGQDYHCSGAVSSINLLDNTLTATVRGTENYTVRLSATTHPDARPDARLSAHPDSGALEHRCTCPYARDEGQFCKHCVAVALAWLDLDSQKPSATPATATTRTRPDAAAPLRAREWPDTVNRKLETVNSATTPAPAIIKLDDLRPWLLSQPKKTLADTLLETAARDRHLREQLLRQAARATGKTPDTTALRAALQRATTTRDFVDYGEAPDFTENLAALADSLAKLNKDGFHAPARDLAEYALDRINANIGGNIDDSDGALGMVTDAYLDAHHEALRHLKPAPAQLAQRLHNWIFSDKYGYFDDIIDRYADLLGPAGLATLRALAEPRLKQNTTNTAANNNDTTNTTDDTDDDNDDDDDDDDDTDTHDTTDTHDYTAAHVLRTIARLTHDTEALIALETRDLTSLYAYLRAAEIYRDARQPAKSLEWAERGMEKFPVTTSAAVADPRLVDFLIAEYLRRATPEFHDKATALAWQLYAQHPNLQNYQRLKNAITAAKRATAPNHDWPANRARALDTLRQTLDEKIRAHAHAQAEAEKNKKTARRSSMYYEPMQAYISWQPAAPDYSELVRVHLHENDTDAAWTAATAKNCDETLWLALADKRAPAHPADALPIYLRHAHALVQQTSNPAYKEAIGHLRKIKTLHARLAQTDIWQTTLAAFRQTYRQKRNFIALLAAL